MQAGHSPRAERRRTEIIDVATRHFNRAGLSGSTLGSIAASAGMVTNGITYYYRRKEDLAAACLIRSIRDLGALLETALAANDPAMRLRRLLQAWFARLAQSATGAAAPVMVFNDIRALPAPQSETVFAEYNQMFRTVRRLFDGTGIADDPLARNARTHLLLSILHAAQEWFDDYAPVDHAQVAERIYAILHRGLGPVGGLLASVTPDLPPGEDPVREAYLRAAIRMINLHGYRGASVEKIAGELNLTKGAFYHHINAKDDLVVDCFEHTFTVLRQAQDAGFATAGTGAERLAATVSLLLGWQVSEAGPLLRISAFNSLPETIRPQMRATADRLLQRFGWLLTDAQSDGSMPVHDTAIGARTLHSMINAVIELDWWAPEGRAPAALPDYALPLFHGLLAPLPAAD